MKDNDTARMLALAAALQRAADTLAAIIRARPEELDKDQVCGEYNLARRTLDEYRDA